MREGHLRTRRLELLYMAQCLIPKESYGSNCMKSRRSNISLITPLRLIVAAVYLKLGRALRLPASQSAVE